MYVLQYCAGGSNSSMSPCTDVSHSSTTLVHVRQVCFTVQLLLSLSVQMSYSSITIVPTSTSVFLISIAFVPVCAGVLLPSLTVQEDLTVQLLLSWTLQVCLTVQLL